MRAAAFDRGNVAFVLAVLGFVGIASIAYKNDSIFELCDRVIFGALD